MLAFFQYCNRAFAGRDAEITVSIRLEGKQVVQLSRLGDKRELHLMRLGPSISGPQFHMTANLLGEFDKCGLWIADHLRLRINRPSFGLRHRRRALSQPPLCLQPRDGAQCQHRDG